MLSQQKTIEALTKLVNSGVTSGVEVLNVMLASDIRPDMPSLRVIEPYTLLDGEQMLADESGGFAVIEMGFHGSLKGNSGLVFQSDNAWKFIEKVAGDDAGAGEFDFVSKGVLTEIGNIVLNRVMGAISNALAINLDYVVPNFFEGNLDRLWNRSPDKAGLVAATRFTVDDFATEGNIVVFFDEVSFSTLMSLIEEDEEGG
jgi:chemotaxis protein CheC